MEPAFTSWIWRALVALEARLTWASAATPTETPSRAWVGVSPFAIWSTIGMTSSIGIAKPTPMLPLSPPALWPAVAIEALMPTTLPFRSTSAPPLLPGLIAASVWIAG